MELKPGLADLCAALTQSQEADTPALARPAGRPEFGDPPPQVGAHRTGTSDRRGADVGRAPGHRRPGSGTGTTGQGAEEGTRLPGEHERGPDTTRPTSTLAAPTLTPGHEAAVGTRRPRRHSQQPKTGTGSSHGAGVLGPPEAPPPTVTHKARVGGANCGGAEDVGGARPRGWRRGAAPPLHL